MRSADQTGQRCFKIGGFSDKSIADTGGNVEALRKMPTENTTRLVAVTPVAAPEGVVLRDRIVTRLLVDFAPKDKQSRSRLFPARSWSMSMPTLVRLRPRSKRLPSAMA